MSAINVTKSDFKVSVVKSGSVQGGDVNVVVTRSNSVVTITTPGPQGPSGGGGGGGTPGGSSGEIQFNNAGAFDGTAGLTWDAANKAVSLASATQTTSHPVLDATQTWNAGGVAFDAIKVNVTDSASDPASTLLNLQVGGVYSCRVSKDGRLDLGAIGSPDLSATRDAQTIALLPIGSDTARIISSTGSLDIAAAAAGATVTSPGTLTLKATAGATSIFSNGSLAATFQTTGVLAIGSGTTSSGAGLLRRAAQLETRLADNSLITTHVLAHKITASAPTDASFTNPVDGIIAMRSSNGHIYVRNGGVWVDVTGSGTGDVVGPASAVSGNIATFNTTTGKLIADGGNTVAGVLNRANHTGTQAVGTITGLAAVATSASATDLTAGALPAARMPALTGDVTTTAGAVATTIAAGAVTLAKQAALAANSIQGNNTGSPATPIALTATQTKTLLAIASTDVSGLGTLATASSVSLTTQATGTLQAAQEPAHTGDVTNTAGSLVMTIAANAVTNAKTATMAATTIKANVTGALANATDATPAQVAAILPTFGASGGSHAAGLVPDPGAVAGTSKFLREDATWATPGGGGSPGGSTGQVQYNNAGAFDGAANAIVDADGNIIQGQYTTTDAPTPASGVVIFGCKKGGKTLVKYNDSVGNTRELQHHIGTTNVKWVRPRGSSTTIDSQGIAVTAIGTATSATFNTATFRQECNRIMYASAAGAGSSCGSVWSSAQFLRSASAGRGGWYFMARFAFPVQQSTWRFAVGMFNTSASIGNVNPSTVLNKSCVGMDSSDTDVWFMNADGTTNNSVATTFGTTLGTGDVFEYRSYLAPGGSTIYQGFGRITPGSTTWVENVQTTNLPSTGGFMAPQIWMNNGTTAAAVNVEWMIMYGEKEV